ncbi:MAG: DegV family protein [Clostridia bacterium]|nr:DegV family protein [Clostridia bacterium]
MPNYRIYTDATSDIPEYLAKEWDVNVIPMEVDVGGKTYLYEPTGKELTPEKFYELAAAGEKATTTQITQYRFEEIFAPVLEAGEDVLYIAFSSALSGTYNAACMAAEVLNEKYPDNKLVVVDTLAASFGETVLTYYAVKMRDAGASIEEIAKWLTDHRLNQCHWFTVDDLMHLKRGGRVSAAAAAFGTVLQIKPVMHVDDEGRLVPVDKVRGRKASLKAIVKEMEKSHLEGQNDIVIVGHSASEEDALYVKKLIEESIGYKDVIVGQIGPVIGAHSGKGTMAVFYLGSKR